MEKIGLSFNEILANCDAVISKPGYGTVTESVCNQVPVLYIRRGDWPEESHLLNWWQKNGVVEEISRDKLNSGDVIEDLQCLWQKDYKELIPPNGIADACSILSKYIE